MAAAKRGSADGTVSKMLCLHLPSLLSFAEVEKNNHINLLIYYVTYGRVSMCIIIMTHV